MVRRGRQPFRRPVAQHDLGQLAALSAGSNGSCSGRSCSGLAAEGPERSTFLRRPSMDLGAGPAHQHGPFTVVQAVGQAEGLDALFVGEYLGGAGPVATPQATLEAPAVEQ